MGIKRVSKARDGTADRNLVSNERKSIFRMNVAFTTVGKGSMLDP